MPRQRLDSPCHLLVGLRQWVRVLLTEFTPAPPARHGFTPDPSIPRPLQDSQASFAAGGGGLPPTQLEEQWDQEPHVMLCFQVRCPCCGHCAML